MPKLLPMPSITDDPRASGILPLWQALKRFPGRKAVIYYRKSCRSAAGVGKWKLKAVTDLLAAEISKVMEVAAVFIGVEEGKQSTRPRKLREAAAFAASIGAVLVTWDESRFIRSESYSRAQRFDPFVDASNEAVPTRDEYAQLHEFTLNVPLVTLADPMLSEAERHRLAMARSKQAGIKPGRPPKPPLEPHIALQIHKMAGVPIRVKGGIRWQTPISKIAKRLKRFGVTRADVQTFLESLVPPPYSRWKDVPSEFWEPPSDDPPSWEPSPEDWELQEPDAEDGGQPPPFTDLIDPVTEAYLMAHVADPVSGDRDGWVSDV